VDNKSNETHGAEWEKLRDQVFAERKELKNWAITELREIDEKYEKGVKIGHQRDRLVSGEEQEARKALRKEFIHRLDQLDAKYGGAYRRLKNA
jgi:hypothetical protein